MNTIIKENETTICEKCKKELTFNDLTFYKGTQNINKNDKHSLVIEYNGNAGRELEDKYGELFWEKANNTEMDVALILGGECCEGDYIVIGSDFNELQVILQALSTILGEHHSENGLNFHETFLEVQRLMEIGKTKYRIIHWG